MRKVVVYSTQNCPYCRMAKAFLEKHGVTYESVDVGNDAVQAQKMIELSGQRGVPVIGMDSEVIVGFDAQRLNELFGEPLKSESSDVIIVGAGPAGLTAAVYCARKMLSTVIISENIGGQALESWAIENYMGYRMVSGEELIKKFDEQVRKEDVRFVLDRVIALKKKDGLFVAETISENSFKAKTVILAQGNKPRKLGVQKEDEYLGRGLSFCSTCDGPLYRGKKVAIAGGGNSALQTAVEISDIRADPVYVDRLQEKNNLNVHLQTNITALHGDNFLTGISIKTKNGVERDLELDGLFIEIGWLPNTGFLDGFVELNEHKEIAIDINCHTNVEGVFAAGDVTSIKGKQIIIAAGEGAKAALEAHEYLMKQ
jgi:alkyl hydroperoxide reductase subunit F